MTAPAPGNHAAPLLMLRLLPDLAALGRWVAASGQRALRDDIGYALHAALRAILGELAPKPFALLQRPGSVQLIGYSTQAVAALQSALDMAAISDPSAAAALGLQSSAGALIKSMPQAWQAGQLMSFEVRVAPVVRSRVAGGQVGAAGGAYPEIDAAWHPDFAGATPGDRQAAHARWLARELARGGAATLLAHRAVAFALSPMARRSQLGCSGGGRRSTHQGLLPDLTVRGQLRVDDPSAFPQLLMRGLGRHRSFGFGCLLLAPPGAWS
jgi:CRISPR system Cascade subunit CasE